MIDLSAEIQAFLEAVYGKDVRAAMVSGAEKIQEEVNDAIEHQLVTVDDTLTVQGAGADAQAVGVKFNNSFRQLPNVSSTGHSADEYAEESGWRAVTVALDDYPFSSGGLLINYVPRSTNARYQIAMPYSIYDSVSTRRRAANGTWSDWVPTSEMLKDKVVIGRSLTAEYDPVGKDDTYPVYYVGDVVTVQLNKIVKPGNYILDGSWNVIDSPIPSGTRFLEVEPFSTYGDARFTRQTMYDATDPFGTYYVRQARTRQTGTTNLIWREWTKLSSGGGGGQSGKGTMLSKVNSILRGSVWAMNSATGTIKFKELASWGNAPDTVVAERLGVPETGMNINREQRLHSSTGLLYDPEGDSPSEEGETAGSFIDNICGNEDKGIAATPLEDYDYLFTQFWIRDLTRWALGTVNDSASTDTIAGNVRKLVDYINTSNSSCRLILTSVPPHFVDYTYGSPYDKDGETISPYGDTVFEYEYPSNTHLRSIADLDVLMHQMAEKYHFVYIDYQQMSLSYHWRDFAGGEYEGERYYNGHLNDQMYYRRLGQYLAEHV